MMRRTLLALVACLSWAVASGAGAQTTTTSTSTSTSSSTSSTTSTSTTSTTVVNPCTGQPCTAQPPVATLSGSEGNVRLDPFEYCWRAIAGDTTQCIAATPAPIELVPVALVIRSGETLTLAFSGTGRPTEVVLQRGDQPGLNVSALTPANPAVFVAELPVGIYTINFRTKWNQGDVTYRLKVDVRAQPRPLALTG